VAGKGCFFSKQQLQRIVQLLASTDMSVAEIAERMSCSKSGIVAVNRRYEIRHYHGWRNHWTVSDKKIPLGSWN
jgi:hypothetical protein